MILVDCMQCDVVLLPAGTQYTEIVYLVWSILGTRGPNRTHSLIETCAQAPLVCYSYNHINSSC